MERFKKVVQRSTYITCFGGLIFALPLMFLTAADVVSRSFLNKPLPGVVELSEYMLSIIILLGVAYTQQVKGHVGVSFFVQKLSQRRRDLIEIITFLPSIFIVALVCVQGFLHGIKERTVSDMLRIPQMPFRLLVAVGCFLLLLELFVGLFDAIRRLKKI